jgi:hypothetical protein
MKRTNIMESQPAATRTFHGWTFERDIEINRDAETKRERERVGGLVVRTSVDRSVPAPGPAPAPAPAPTGWSVGAFVCIRLHRRGLVDIDGLQLPVRELLARPDAVGV